MSETPSDYPEQDRPAAPQAERGDAVGTSPPPEAENQSTVPPGNGALDEDALVRSRDGLDQAGGGH